MKENIYYIHYIVLRLEDDGWKSERGQGYYSASNEDEAIIKCIMPLIKMKYGVDVREVKKIEVQQRGCIL